MYVSSARYEVPPHLQSVIKVAGDRKPAGRQYAERNQNRFKYQMKSGAQEYLKMKEVSYRLKKSEALITLTSL